MLYADDFYLLIPFMLLNMGGYYLLLNSHYHLFEIPLFRRGLFLLITIITYALMQINYRNIYSYYITSSKEISLGFIFSLSSIIIMLLIFRDTIKCWNYFIFILSAVILTVYVKYVICYNVEEIGTSDIGLHWIFQYLIIIVISIIFIYKGYRIVSGDDNNSIKIINIMTYNSKINDIQLLYCIIFCVFIIIMIIWYILRYHWSGFIEYYIRGILFSILMFFTTMKCMGKKIKISQFIEIIIMSLIVGIISGILSNWLSNIDRFLTKSLSLHETLQYIWYEIKGWVQITLIHISLYIGINMMIRANGCRLMNCTAESGPKTWPTKNEERK